MTEKPFRRVRWKLMVGFAGFWGVVTLYAYAYFLWWASIALGAALFGSGFFIDRKHTRLEGKVAVDSENNTHCRKARSWPANQKLWFCLRHRNSPLRPGA